MERIRELLSAGLLCAGLLASCLFVLQKPQGIMVVAQVQEPEPVYENRLEKIRETGVLTVCTSPDYAPYEFEVTGKNGTSDYAGADISLAKYLAERLGAELQLLTADFDVCMDMVEQGEADLMLAGMLPLAERKQKMALTRAYHTDGEQCLVVRNEEEEGIAEPASLDALAGKTVAAQYGTLQAQLVVEQLPESYMHLTFRQEETVRMLKNGQVDAIALAKVPAEQLLKKESGLAMFGEGLDYMATELVAGAPKNEQEFLDAVNDLLGEAADSGIYFEWLDEAYEKAASQQP